MKPLITQIKTDTRRKIIRVIFLKPCNPRLKHEYKFTKITPNLEIMQIISAQISWPHNTALPEN
jgi:CRISPR/Cas system-associated endonuclease Cas1